MADLDKLIYFSCPDGCGQLGVACSIRMILDDAPFICESCGCEFHGRDFPGWLLNAACGTEQKKSPEYEIMVMLFAYLRANGSCPSETVLSQLLRADRALWKLFPAEKIPPSDMLCLLEEEEEFRSRLDCSRLDCAHFVALITSRPDLLERPDFARFCNWDNLSSLQWKKLLIAVPASKILHEHCDWSKIRETDWEKILRDGKNVFAIAVYHVGHGKEIASSLEKFPGIEKYIKWEKIEVAEWLSLLEKFPRSVKKCPWNKVYEYIVRLPPGRRSSLKEQFPQLWNKRSELVKLADWPELQKLPKEKYYTVLDFFDWEDFFDYPALSQTERIELFSRHPQFAERFGWNNIPSEEKVRMAVRCADFGNYYGWDKFSEDEMLNILKEKPDYLRYFDSEHFNRNVWMKLSLLNEAFADKSSLNFFDYLLFRKFDSKIICAKITFAWHFIISILTFAGIGYLMLDGPCGFKALWAESRVNAFTAAAVYLALSILWSAMHAWLFSGRTPFLLTVVSSIAGALLASVQFFYTFFLAKISLSNYICWGILFLLVFLFIAMRLSDGELFVDNESGLVALTVFYIPALLLSVAICQPCFHWQYVRVCEQMEHSARPFRSARLFYLQAALASDPKTQTLIREAKQAVQNGNYKAGKELFDKIPGIYASAPEIKKLADELEILRQNQLQRKN